MSGLGDAIFEKVEENRDLINTGLGAVGLFQSSRDLSSAKAKEGDYVQMLLNQFDDLIGLDDDNDGERRQVNNYIRMIEAKNREALEEERFRRLQELDEYKARLDGQVEANIERQLEEDREAARIAIAKWEEIRDNKGISADERAFAEEQLKEAQKIARNERSDERRRLLEDRERAIAERNYAVRQRQMMQDQAIAERQYSQAAREEIENRISGFSEQLGFFYDSLGKAPKPTNPITGEDIFSEYEVRRGEYEGDVDRAVDRIASVNEANLIERGVDDSTTGVAARDKIVQDATHQYNLARRRAFDDSINYITGAHGAISGSVDTAYDQRGKALAEHGGVLSAGIDQLLQLRDPQSIANAFGGDAKSAIYARDIGSGNNYRAPVQVGSEIYEGDYVSSLSPNFRVTDTDPTRAGVESFADVFQPYNYQFDDATSSYRTGLNNNLVSLINNARSDQTGARERQQSSGNLLGTALGLGVKAFSGGLF